MTAQRGRPWSPEDKELVRRLGRQFVKTKEIARILRRTRHGVSNMRRQLDACRFLLKAKKR